MLLVNVDIFFSHHETANRERTQIHKPSMSAGDGNAVTAFLFFLIIFNSEMFLYDCMTAALLSHPTLFLLLQDSPLTSKTWERSPFILI